MNGVTLLQGDVREQLATLPDDSVHCVVTSPPYWNLRDYQVSGQLGLETTPEEYIANMVDVFREVRRVLRFDGTCWINIGDSYAAKPCLDGSDFRDGRANCGKRLSGGGSANLKPKDLVGIPWMLAFALRADGWWLRQDIIWHKPAPMPESVTDRCTKAHEYIFLLTKSKDYFFDCEAIKEPVSGGAHSRGTGTTPKSGQAGFGTRNNDSFSAAVNGLVDTRNKRSVWTINTESYSGAHFACFPTKLVAPCILAGTSEHGVCASCGAPWQRLIEKDRVATRPGNDTKVGRVSDDEGSPYEGHSGSIVGNRDPQRHTTTTKTVGWEPTCGCECPDLRRPLVMDIFNGSGTTGQVARDCGCEYIGIELNPDYIALSKQRLQQGSLLV